MTDRLRIAAALVITACLAAPLAAEGEAKKPAPKPVGSSLDALLGAFNWENGKITTMAEDFPADKYDFKPNPAQRSFGEQVLHVVESNNAIVGMIGGKEGGTSLPPAEYNTKEKIVAALKASIDNANAALKAKGDDGLKEVMVNPWGNFEQRVGDFAYGFVMHVAEHYGQLVVYYRVNGMVPPSSRSH
jgi:uncharacterized damage-inducible protein DinB